MVCGSKDVKDVEVFHAEATVPSNPWRRENMHFVRETNKSSVWLQWKEGMVKSEDSSNWNYPQEIGSGEMSLIPAHAHVLSCIRLFYHQPCLETAEVLWMPNTLKPSHPGIDSTPGKVVLWPLQVNQLKCASGESVTQLL